MTGRSRRSDFGPGWSRCRTLGPRGLPGSAAEGQRRGAGTGGATSACRRSTKHLSWLLKRRRRELCLCQRSPSVKKTRRRRGEEPDAEEDPSQRSSDGPMAASATPRVTRTCETGETRCELDSASSEERMRRIVFISAAKISASRGVW